MIEYFKYSWWSLVLRGLLAILFGILALIWPGITLEVLILFFGGFALADGFFSAAGALANRKHDKTWWLFFFSGIAGIIVGILTFFLPELTAFVLVILIAARALLVGLFEITAAIRLRKTIKDEWILILDGLLSLLFAVVLFLLPGLGALALVWMIGITAIILGVLLFAIGVRVRGWKKSA